MRITRASVVTAVFAGSAIVAGPLVGVALAVPSLQSSTPANGSVFTSASAVPSVLKVTYDKALNSPTSPVFPSHISVTVNGAFFPCTAALDPNDSKTLTCTPFAGTPYSDGTYVISTTASPAATTGDTTAAHDAVSFLVDTTPPQLASTSPADASRVNSTGGGFAVSATYKEPLSAAGSSISVTNSVHNIVAGTSSLTGSATVSWSPSSALPEGGPFTATSTVTDVHGLTSTNSWTFITDNTAPPVPTVTAPSYIDIANQHHVPITGTSDNSTGATTKIRVAVLDGATTLVTLPDFAVNNDGSWSVPASSNDLSSLPDKPLTITAKAIDAAGNISAASTPAATTKDTVAPVAPTVTFPSAAKDTNNQPVVNASNSSLEVAGVTEAGAGVSVTATDGPHVTTPVTTIAGNDGKYDVSIETASLNSGTLTVTTTATDAAGNASPGSNTITKNVAAPGTPVITTFGDVNAANEGSPHTVSGTAPTASGTTLDVWLTDSAGGTTQHVHPSIAGDGTWTTTLPVNTLASGTLVAHAFSTSQSNNVSDEATKVATKDVDKPLAPTFVAPAWINIATKAAVPISGTAEPFSTVHLVATDSAASTAPFDVPVGGDGTWSTSLDLHSLAEGVVTYAVTAKDAVGNVSDPTDVSNPTNHQSTKDTVAPAQPAAPALSQPDVAGVVTATGGGVNADTVLVTLTSDGGAGQATGPATVSSGTYSAPVDASALPDGTLTGTVTETDPAGNTSAASPATTVVKDTTALALSSTSPVDLSSAKNVSLLSATYNEQLDLANSTITLRDPTNTVIAHNAPSLSADKKTISAAPANAQLAEGAYQVTFSVKDLTNETKVTTVHFTVDRTAPAAPVVTSVAGIYSGNVSNVPVSGTASEPGDAIAVLLSDGSHQATGSTVVANDGTWSTFVDASNLSDGSLIGTATQTDAANNESAQSASAPSTKDTSAPAKPSLLWSGPVSASQHSVTLSGVGEPGSTVDVSVDDTDGATSPVTDQTTVAGDGTWSKLVDLSALSDGTLTATAWQVDPAGNVGAAQTADGTKDTGVPVAPTAGFSGPVTIANPSVTISGSGEDGDTVSISVDDDSNANTAPVTATAPVSGGAWSKSLDLSGLSDGTLTATVTEADAVGNVSSSGQGTGLKDATAPGSPTVNVAGPATGANQTAVPISGTGTAGDIVNLQISDGSNPAVTASLPVAGDGTWSTTSDLSGLSDGSIALSATEVDAVNNDGTPALRTFAKDTAAPAKPTVSWSNAVNQTVSSVTFSGTAEPGSTVSISADDADALTPAVADTTTAGQDGTWSKQLTLSSLDDGSLLASAFATDTFGNQGLAQTASGTKDTVLPTATMLAPAKPFVLSTAAAGWSGSDAGSGLAASPFDVQWARAAHGKPLGSYVALLTGVSTTSASRTLTGGTAGCFEVRAHDAAGNVSGWSRPRCTTVLLDDKALTRSAGWTRVSNSKYFHGSALRTTTKGASLTLASSPLHQVAILATHCPTCGSIVVWVGSHKLGVINLQSATLQRRVLTTFVGFRIRTAAVTIRVASSGKRIEVDGIGSSAH